MYFLRRRHGRKNQSDQRPRRDHASPMSQATQPQQAIQPQQQAHQQAQHHPDYAPEELVASRPVVITKTRRLHVEAPEDEGDFKQPGTFRAGTLHIAHAAQAPQGKL